MQLKALRYFLAVASTGSFLASARQFQVPASSVSRFIAALEKDLGRQLFYRSTRAVRLTEAGEQFFLQVRDAVELLDQAAEQLGAQNTGIRGLVRINAPEAFGRLHVAHIVNQLQAKYPELVVELTLTDAFIDPVQEGVDITIRVGPLLDSGLIGRVIGPHRHLLVASPDYLGKHGTPEQPQDLIDHHCLVYKGQLGAQKWYFRRDDDEPFKALQVSGPLRSNNAEALLAAAVAGRGLVLFPTWLFNAETMRRGELVPLLKGWYFSTQPEQAYMQMLSPENRLRSAKVREVSAFLMEAIGSPPYWDRA
ncbi:MAG TPA: LysR family transcriptional regulator [Stenotrophomonas sp.]|jgi:DNA-binding transcriptional LysR family regulator